MKKRLKQIYNNISFPAQASDFTLKIFSSMASDKVYDITRLTGCSQNILENMQISASIVLQDNYNKKWKKKRVPGFTVTSPPRRQLDLLFISFNLVSYFSVVLLVVIWLVMSHL